MIRRLLLLAVLVKVGKVAGRVGYFVGEYDGWHTGYDDATADRLAATTQSKDS